MSFEKKIPLAFLLAVILLIVLAVFAFRSVATLDDAIKLENHTQEVLQKLDKVFINTVDAETGVRGFIITGNERFLEPYRNAEQENRENMDALRQLVSNSPTQNKELPIWKISSTKNSQY